MKASSMGGRTSSSASWRSGAWSGSPRSSWAGPTYPSTGQATGSPAGNHTDTKHSAPRGAPRLLCLFLG